MAEELFALQKLTQLLRSEEFIQNSYRQKPAKFHVPDVSQDLFGSLSLEILLNDHLRLSNFELFINGKFHRPDVSSKSSDRFYTKNVEMLQSEKILPFIAAGASLRVNDYHRYPQSGQREFLRVLNRYFRMLPSCNLYYTPKNGECLPTHNDSYSIIVIQARGEKTWTFEDSQEIILRQDEILYLPPKVSHHCRADSSSSLHLTYGLHPYTLENLLSSVISDLDKNQLLQKTLIYSSTDLGLEASEEERVSLLINQILKKKIKDLSDV